MSALPPPPVFDRPTIEAIKGIRARWLLAGLLLYLAVTAWRSTSALLVQLSMSFTGDNAGPDLLPSVVYLVMGFFCAVAAVGLAPGARNKRIVAAAIVAVALLGNLGLAFARLQSSSIPVFLRETVLSPQLILAMLIPVAWILATGARAWVLFLLPLGFVVPLTNYFLRISAAPFGLSSVIDSAVFIVGAAMYMALTFPSKQLIAARLNPR